MKQWEQPNSVTFMAHLSGDEFFIQFTTNDGYEIREGSDGWYYYAVLNENDDIVTSNKKVGIDTPPAESYNLQLPAYKQQEIEDQRAQFMEELQQAAEWYRQKREEANRGTVTFKIGVILVDFADSVHWKTSDPPYPFPNGYDKHYFNELIFSNDGTWFDTLLTQLPETHPENQKVFGSLRDYYNQQSRGKLDITGKGGLPEILNPEDPQHPGIPDWVYLDEEKAYWNSLPLTGINWSAFHGAAITKFEQKFPGINIAEYDRIVLIYAGNRGNGVLWPSAMPMFGYHMSERDHSAFSHIGIHSHEFAHLLGAFDEYGGSANPVYWSVMAWGSSNGPAYHSACPSGFSPFYRIHWDWVNAAYLNAPGYQNLVFEYDYSNPQYYRIDVPDNISEYFILENRLREGFDLWTPNDPGDPPQHPLQDPNGNEGGLMIWHIDDDNFVNYNSDIVFYKSAGRYG
ncbi:MAG: hypothetical protein Kow0042_16280 [Calditrichia bacterium]